MARREEGPTPLGELEALLSCAQEVAARLASDPLIPRLLTAFARIPASDRETVLGVIERDGNWCRVAEQTAETTGITVRANPHASLYLHVLNPTEPLPDAPLQRDVDVIASGIEQFLLMLPMLFQNGVHLQWVASARELARSSSDDTRRLAVRMACEVLDIISEVDPTVTR
jgi:hypothetical protein